MRLIMNKQLVVATFFSETKNDFEVMDSIIKSSNMNFHKVKSLALESAIDFNSYFSGITVMLCGEDDAVELHKRLCQASACGNFSAYAVSGVEMKDVEVMFNKVHTELQSVNDVVCIMHENKIPFKSIPLLDH